MRSSPARQIRRSSDGFRDARGAFYDEESRPVDRPFEPLGEWRLHEDVTSIEAAVVAALRG